LSGALLKQSSDVGSPLVLRYRRPEMPCLQRAAIDANGSDGANSSLSASGSERTETVVRPPIGWMQRTATLSPTRTTVWQDGFSS
jgi:hypothetical protein